MGLALGYVSPILAEFELQGKAMRSAIKILIAVTSCFLSGCGTYVPPLEEYTQDSAQAGNLVHAVLANVTCEVQNSLYDVLEEDRRDFHEGILAGRLTTWLESWGVQIALNFTVDERGSINATANGFPPSPATAIANLAGSVTATSTATRVSKLHAFHAVRDISRRRCLPHNRPGGLFMMQSDLKLKE